MTHSDAERAVDDGSYKELTDSSLIEMRTVCMNVQGTNAINVDRVRRKGDLINDELVRREKVRREEQANLQLSSEQIGKLLSANATAEHSPRWDESSILKLIADSIEESFGLEYKAAPALSRDSQKKAEITKDVSAMANSAGGTIIYGLAQFQDSEREHRPERIDPVQRSQFSKEWLEQIIAQIRPRINGIRITSVQLDSAADHVAYVVEVPQSTTAHQAIDHRYYRRYNFQAVPMVDYEIRDVMNRRTTPEISISAKLVVYSRRNSDDTAGALVLHIKNDSNVLARYISAVVHAPMKLLGDWIYFPDSELNSGPEGDAFKMAMSNHNGPPLFPKGTLRKIFPFKIRALQSLPEKHLLHFRWIAFADEMPMKSGTFEINEVLKDERYSS